MPQPFKAPRGVTDILPTDQPYWRFVRETAMRVAESFGYGQIETPVFEHAGLFLRPNAEGTDVIDKEVYAEVIDLLSTFYDALGLRDYTLQLNSIGDGVCRPAYIEKQRAYYADKIYRMCGDCKRRYDVI